MVRNNKYSKSTALFLGAGYCAQEMYAPLLEQGYKVYVTTRTKKRHSLLKKCGVIPLIFNGAINSKLRSIIGDACIILSSMAPVNGIDPFLNKLPIDQKKLIQSTQWVGYLSSTSVYGDKNGQWVFEDELLYPSTTRGKERLNAEIQWLEIGAPVHIFRLAGIYGPSRNNFQKIKQNKTQNIVKEGHVTNRVHVGDVANAILTSIANPDPYRIYNVSDGNPAPPQDIINFSAHLLGIPTPPLIEYEGLELPAKKKNFYQETKRVSNNRITNELSWTPRYPDYRSGLMHSLKVENDEVDTIYLSGHFDVAKQHIQETLLLLPEHIKLSREEKGCLDFRVTQSKKTEGRFQVFEKFNSKRAYLYHQKRIKNSKWKNIMTKLKRDYEIIGIDTI